MPPLNVTKASGEHHIRFVQSDTNNNQTEDEKKNDFIDEDEQISKEFKYFHVVKPIKDKKNVRFIYIDETKFGLVWPNIIMFTVLHFYYIYALAQLVANMYSFFYTWVFRKFDILLYFSILYSSKNSLFTL